MRSRITLLLILNLLASALVVSPAFAQTPKPSVVQTVLFFSPMCASCKQIVEIDLPPAIEGFGSQLQILYVDVNTVEGAGLFSAAVETYEAPRVVPLLIFGQAFLVGERIITEFPSLVDTHLAQGGLEWPPIPGLGEYLTVVDMTSTPLPSPTAQIPLTPQEPQPTGAVHAILFWMDGCPHCHEVLDNVLPPLQEKYGALLRILLVEVVEQSDVDRLYEIAAAYSVTKELVGVPFLVIGDRVLIGSQQIPAELPGLIESYLAEGGVDQPEIPGLETYSSLTWLATLAPQPSSTEAKITSLIDAYLNTSETVSVQAPVSDSNGFTLAIFIMALMVVALIYSVIAFAQGKTFRLPAWVDWAIPILVVVGIAVASYLSYIETHSVSAVCGPIGDCNTVQQNPYARLFGFLPIGILGLLGYLGMLIAWLVRKTVRSLERPAAMGFWAMAFFAVVFSLYLTYLEPFVIRAVCLWCLSSSIIVTLLLLLGTITVVRQFAQSQGGEG